MPLHVIIFDYGCVRVFEPEVAHSFAELAGAVRADSRARTVSALCGLGAEPWAVTTLGLATVSDRLHAAFAGDVGVVLVADDEKLEGVLGSLLPLASHEWGFRHVLDRAVGPVEVPDYGIELE